MRKPAFSLCNNTVLCICQSDQYLCCSLPKLYNISSFYDWNLRPQGYKTFFHAQSAKHDFFSAHQFQSNQNKWNFQRQSFILLLKMIKCQNNIHEQDKNYPQPELSMERVL